MATTTLPLLGAMLAMTSRLVMGQLPGHGAWGGGYGTGWGISLGTPVPTADTKPQVLTCAAQQLPDGPRLSVTIRESENNGLYGHAFVPGLPLSPVFSAFASLGQSWGLQQSGGLDVDISVFLLRDVPTAYFILTHFASPAPDACPANTFGQILSPSQGYAGGAHIAGMSSVYGGFVPAQASGSYREQPVSSPGIVTSASVTASTAQSFRVTQMQGFRLQDLAGRGFIVCDSISYNWDWQLVCDTQAIDICCGLTYSSQTATGGRAGAPRGGLFAGPSVGVY